MVENFTDFYDTLFEFSANIAYRIVKEKNISKDIAQEVFMYFLKEEDKLDYSDEECLTKLSKNSPTSSGSEMNCGSEHKCSKESCK